VLPTAELTPQEIRPLKRLEYDRLVELGAFADDRIELIRGNLVIMAPNHPEHASPIDLLAAKLIRALGDRARVRVQQPIYASGESEPEPDIAVVPSGNYGKEHPRHAYLVVEVALSSLRKDREVKAPLYAESGFGEYWIVDVSARSVEVFRSPVAGAYTQVSTHDGASVLRSVEFPDVQIPVADLFE
jgi:Uma2 family endonuclease